jgi:hypothetical protein
MGVVAIGIGVYEAAALAVAAIAAMFAVSPAGQQASRDLARKLSEATESDQTQDLAPPTTDTDCNKKECPPCPEPPPPGSRTDMDHSHWPCPDGHTHYFHYEYNQNPQTCKCYLKIVYDRVECIP